MAGKIPRIDAAKETDRIVSFIRSIVKRASAMGIVVGLSGGVDSAVVGALCVRALGKDRVLGLIMPSDHTPPRDLRDASGLASSWGIRAEEVPISKITKALTDSATVEGTRIARANVEARVRMVISYYFGNTLGYLVAGCLAGDTLVHIGESAKVPIGELAKLNNLVGRNIIVPIRSFNSRTESTEVQPGVVVDSGVKPVFRVTFDDGTHIDVSGDQKFLARREDGMFALTELRKLRKGDEIGVMPIMSEAAPLSMRLEEPVSE